MASQGTPFKARKKGDGWWCVYRADNGDRCAVGVLIPDSLYDSGIESNGIGELFAKREDLAEFFDRMGCDRHFLTKLQIIHDSYQVDTWEQHFRSVALEHGLEFDRPEPETTEESEVVQEQEFGELVLA